MYIVVSKTVLSMENIDTLFRMQRASYSAQDAYDTFCKELEQCLPFVFGCSSTCRNPPLTPPTNGCCYAALSFRLPTRSIWTAALTLCGKSRPNGEDILPDLA